MMQIYVLLVLLVVLPSKLDAACPVGWDKYQDNCYKKFPSALSWKEAKTACEDQGTRLADVMDQGENDFIKNTFPGPAWLGLSRCNEDGTCLVGRDEAPWTNWAPDQPDNEPQNPPGLENKDFGVLIQNDGKWADQPKSEKHVYICKRSEDPCKDIRCNPAGSTCKDGKCICKPGFSGKTCYDLPCDDDPCQNGGSCKDVNAGYKCTCVKNYSGENCQVPPPCEAKKPCVNGVCEDISDVDYKCKCNPGWIGKNCDERPCDKRPCVNAKECINVGTGYKCICKKDWEGENCDKDGSAGGDPHYKTFDGKRFDFMGKCEYIYAKDCSKDHAFEVLQQNEACGGGGRISCTKSIRVLFQKIEVIMQRRGVVYVDGVRVNLPWKKSGSDTKITRWINGAVLNVPDLLLSVSWDGSMGIYVKINQRYEGNMCGLMGDADGNPNDDFQLPDKSTTQNVATFGNSWRKNPKCVNGIVPPDPCKNLVASEYKAIKEKCGKMKQPPFQQCNDRITPDVNYIPNCEYDLCAMKGNPSAAWCKALESYDIACNSKGVNIDWEGKVGFEECGNPCANMPCFNGAKCENVNRKDFKCTCPAGFSGTTCENVDCKSGYISRGNLCYKKMSRRPWGITQCPQDHDFVSAENEDENAFIYEKFVKQSGQSFWMNARVCGEEKLCDKAYGTVFYSNFVGKFPSKGCVQIPNGQNGKWIANDCKAASYFICKYEKF